MNPMKKASLVAFCTFFLVSALNAQEDGTNTESPESPVQAATLTETDKGKPDSQSLANTESGDTDSGNVVSDNTVSDSDNSDRAVKDSVAIDSLPLEQRGLAIAETADQRRAGYGSVKSRLSMVLVNRSGSETVRSLSVKTLEGEAGSKSITLFEKPNDLRGTALLTYAYDDRSDDQWIFLPALKRIKRISSQDKSGPFMGSEFAFEDMSDKEVGRYHYHYLREETCGPGLDCYVIERFPKSKYSGYSKEVVWLDKKEYRVFKVEFFDRKEKLLKTLEVSDYQLYENQFWRPAQMLMSNQVTAKKTRLEMSDYQFFVKLSETEFTPNKLKRTR